MSTKYRYIALMVALALALGACRLWNKMPQKESSHILSPPPLHLGGWRGIEMKTQKSVLDMLGADLFVSRRYFDSDGWPLDLAIVFYTSQGPGRTMHSPLNCYPAEGWRIVNREDVRFSGFNNSRAKVKAKRIVIEKPGKKETVYYWYPAGGRSSEGQLKNKLLTLYSALFEKKTDGALVRVSWAMDTIFTKNNPETDFIPGLIDFLARQGQIKETP